MKNSEIRSYRKFVKPSDEFDSNKKIYFRNGAKQVAKGNAVLADPLNPYVPGELIVNFDSQPSFSKFNSKFQFMSIALFVTSNIEFSNCPILEFIVLHKSQRAFKNHFLMEY